MYPVARSHQLVVQDLADEVLVYDLERHKAHALNPSAAFVWRRCDGKTSVAEMAAALHRELGLPADEGVVGLALSRLAGARLLQEQAVPDGVRYSRRHLLRRLALGGAAALLLPVVSSIVAPDAAAAASTIYIDPSQCAQATVGACCRNPGQTNKYCRQNPGNGTYECTGNPCT